MPRVNGLLFLSGRPVPCRQASILGWPELRCAQHGARSREGGARQHQWAPSASSRSEPLPGLVLLGGLVDGAGQAELVAFVTELLERGRAGGLGRVGRDSPRAVAPERLAGGRVRPNYSPQIAPFKFGLAPQHGKNSSFAVRGLLRAARHASIVRSTARSE